MSDIVLRGQLALIALTPRALAHSGEAYSTHSEPRRGRGDRGQATAEYGLVLLGAAGIALLLVAWATKSGAIGKLFDSVMDSVIGKVK